MTDRHLRASFLELVDGKWTHHDAAGPEGCARCAEAAELRMAFEQEFHTTMQGLATARLPAGTIGAQWTTQAGRGLAAALVAVGVLLLVVGVTLAVPPLFFTPTGADPTPEASAAPLAVDIGVPFEVLDLEPRPGHVIEFGDPSIDPVVTGPVVDVARGRLDLLLQRRVFHFTVYRSVEQGVCIQMDWEPNSGGAGCGSMPGDGPLSEWFGMMSSSTGSPLAHEVVGLVKPGIQAVWIETTTGGRARAQLVSLEPAEIDALLFFVFLPGGSDITAIVAMDAAGNTIERVEFPEVRPDPSGASPTPMPTPAAPPG